MLLSYLHCIIINLHGRPNLADRLLLNVKIRGGLRHGSGDEVHGEEEGLHIVSLWLASSSIVRIDGRLSRGRGVNVEIIFMREALIFLYLHPILSLWDISRE